MSKSSEEGDRPANLSHTFKYLLATQFLSRGIPFIFNTWIVRHLTEEDYAAYLVKAEKIFPIDPQLKYDISNSNIATRYLCWRDIESIWWNGQGAQR
ncbi:hypothetical protein MTR67_024519 [Solanum verrucosum]|uniref:Man(5)GlcNAc(2)-PP-dolichol translocation protein RFT1 n=1 Tax=Solanum verrucosum TaxID=315347 RepID=A0AAF0TT20_SOLVR|nr:hypothetical protein MTR67_024519 [Solanum verrucosum]